MELIITFIQGVFVIALIILGLAVIITPIVVHIQYKLETGQNLINFWLTGLEAIALLPALEYMGNTSQPGFSEKLGFLIIVLIITIILTNKRTSKFGFQGLRKFIAILAQLFSPISFLIILGIMSRILDKDDDKK